MLKPSACCGETRMLPCWQSDESRIGRDVVGDYRTGTDQCAGTNRDAWKDDNPSTERSAIVHHNGFRHVLGLVDAGIFVVTENGARTNEDVLADECAWCEEDVGGDTGVVADGATGANFGV